MFVLLFVVNKDVYTVSQKNVSLGIVHIFAKYWPIFKIYRNVSKTKQFNLSVKISRK